MTDFKKLLENGCMVETNVSSTPRLAKNELDILSCIITHPADCFYDNVEFTFSSDIDLYTLMNSSELDEDQIIEALINLEKQGYIDVYDSIINVGLTLPSIKLPENAKK